MVSCSIFLLLSFKSYVFIRFSKNLMAACLCLGGGGVTGNFGMIISAAFGFLKMLNEKLYDAIWIVISRKLILFSVSVSMVNFIVETRLLKSLQTLCISVSSLLYTMRISSTYLK
jgi:hypothetical protein